MKSETEMEIHLDNTLRYLYHALRLKGGLLLSIKFTYRGIKWEASTIEEALELRRRLDAEGQGEYMAKLSRDYAAQLAREQSPWTPDKLQDLLKYSPSPQKKFLRILLACEAIDSVKLAGELGKKSQMALAGVLSGLSKRLLSIGMRPSDVYRVDTQWKGKQKTRLFSLTNGLRAALIQDGWFDDGERPATAVSDEQTKENMK